MTASLPRPLEREQQIQERGWAAGGEVASGQGGVGGGGGQGEGSRRDWN